MSDAKSKILKEARKVLKRAKEKPRESIRVYWSKRENDLEVDWTRERGTANPRYVIGLFPPHVVKELDERGYDVTTLRFSIKKKPAQETGSNKKQ